MADAYIDNVVLLLHCDGTNGSTTFTDSSLSAHTVTPSGNASLTTAEKKFGTASGYFDGTGDYLTLDGSSDFAFGTGDFTIETWFRTTDVTASQSIIDFNALGGVNGAYPYLKYDTYQDHFVYNLNGAEQCIGTTTVQNNTWYHVAVCRAGSSTRLYINGTQEGSTYTDSTSLLVGSGAPIIGMLSYNSGSLMHGYLDDIRVTKGIARYTTNFIPPTAAFDDPTPPTDPYGANVSLLLHCDGTNGSTTFTDNSLSAHAVTPVGNTQVSTTQSKFGGASAYFDGTGDYITTPSSSDFTMGSGDFTLETFIRPDAVGIEQLICGRVDSGFATQSIRLTLNADHTVKCDVDGSHQAMSSITLSAATWYHLAFVRNGTSGKLYIDGVNSGTCTISGSISDSSAAFSIGRAGEYNGNIYKGFVDEFRLTKGIARYTANFTPPTVAFPDPTIVSVAHTLTGSSAIAVTPSSPIARGRGHAITGSVPVTVTPHATLKIQWHHSLIGASSITVVPYSAKVYLSRNHFITGNVKIDVLPAATLANHATVNKTITGATTINVTSSATTLWHTPNHFKTGSVTLSVTPTTSTWTRAQYQGGNAALTIPSLFAYATGWKEEPQSAALVLPSLIGTGVGGAIACGTLPSLLITATGTQELHGTAEAILPGLYFEGTGQREYNGTAALVVPGFNASSYGAAIAELILPSFTVSATGTAEFGGKAGCILPGLVIAATGQREYNGTAALVLPGFRGGDIGRAALVMPGLFISASGSVGFANSVGYILNVHTNESYEWSNMGFLHIIRIGTDYYGVRSTGLYKLSTAYTTDAGTAINANILTKSTDFGSYHSKRLPVAYIGSDSSTTLTPIVDGVTKQSHASSFGGRKTRLSLGNHGRYWQLKISGIQGELTGLELVPQELQRRVK
jgi:hypothetical protein